MDIKDLRQTVEKLFTKRTQLMTLMQEIAENFYPERADFTVRREIGDEWAGNLTTSYPILCRRELGDQFGTMLRNTAKSWFHMAPTDTGRENNDAKRWLEYAETVQRRAMYDRVARLTRATKEGDHDYAAFGQCVLSARLNKTENALLYRCWHIRDVVWMENEEGAIGLVGRKWKPYASDLLKMFKNNHPALEQKARQDPFCEIDCYHIVVEADMYDGDAKRRPYWSIYFDCTHNHLLEAVPVWNKEYIIPRWQTVSGSQYAYSPATIVALPDARLIQSMTYTLLEAGEKLVTPPMVAVQDAIRSDVSVYAGGITWVASEYDERLGEVLRPLTQDAKGMPIGIDMQRDARTLLMQAFYLNKLNLPRNEVDMTAYEFGQRVQEYIRGATPIFEPTEQDYNGQLCEVTFDLLMRGGAFGPLQNMPPSLMGADIQFRFESPLHDAIDQQKGTKFLEMKSMIAQAMALDQTAIALPDVKTALRDVLVSIGTPAKWINNEVTVDQITKAQQAAAQAQQVLAAMQQGSDVAATMAGAEKDISQAA